MLGVILGPSLMVSPGARPYDQEHLLKCLRHDLSSQVNSLVKRSHLLVAATTGKEPNHMVNTLSLGIGVRFCVSSEPEFTLAKVYSAGVYRDDDKTVPQHTEASGREASTREPDAKKQGHSLPYMSIPLRSFRRPGSGRTAPLPHAGPPRRTASALFAAAMVSSVRAVPWASMEH